jgi:hypothetical protein
MAGVAKRGCVDPDTRIDQVVSIINNLEVVGNTYTAGCGIAIDGSNVITAAVDGVSIICEDGVLKAVAASDLVAGCGISINTGVISVVVDDTTMSCVDGILVCNSLAFSTIHATDTLGNPQTDLVAEAFGDTLNIVGGPGFILTTSSGSDTLQFDFDATTFLTIIVPGAGIEFDGDEILADLGRGLQFDAPGVDGKIEVYLYEFGGLEFRDRDPDDENDSIQDKARWHLCKGLATSTTSPGVPGVDNVEPLHGESPVASASDVVTPHGLPLWVGNNEEVVIKYNYDGTTASEDDVLSAWTTDTVENLRLIMAGFPGFAVANNLLLGHAANETDSSQPKMQWKDFVAWSKTAPGYVHGNDQVFQHEAGSDPRWQDTTEDCPEETP